MTGLAPPAQAVDRQEVLIGTFGGPLAKPAESRVTTPTGADTPADLLAEALALLGAGDQAGAQRQFEVLVARHPDAAEAGHARRYLGESYRAAPSAAAGPRQPASAARPETRAQESDANPAARPAAVTEAGDGWRARVQPEPALGHRLMSEAGDRVFFSSGSAELGGRARAVLAAQAAWLKRNPAVRATIEGHADEPGGEAENRVLSLDRAEAVRRRLIESGIAPERLAINGAGRSGRVAECPEAECQAHNRRTVTVPFTLGTDEAPAAVSSEAPRRGEHGRSATAAVSQADGRPQR